MIDRVMAAISGKRTSTTPPQAPAAKKPYQPQNGHASISVSAVAVQHKRVSAFTDHYLEFLDLNKTADQEEFSGQFKVSWQPATCHSYTRDDVLRVEVTHCSLVHLQQLPEANSKQRRLHVSLVGACDSL